MSREIHVRFCEGLGVRFPRATRLVVQCRTRFQCEEAERRVRDILRRPQVRSTRLVFSA